MNQNQPEKTSWLQNLRVRLVLLLRPWGLLTAIDYWDNFKRRLALRSQPVYPITDFTHVLVICANYNHAKWIGGCIESVIRQSFTRWTLVLIDDQSTDGSLQVIRPYCMKDERVQLVQLPKNSGAYCARNTGIAAMKHLAWTHVTFIDPDDVASPGWLEHMLHQCRPGMHLVRPLLQRVNASMTQNHRRYYGYCPSLYTRELWNAIGGFMDVRIAGDTECVLRAERLLELNQLRPANARQVVQICRMHSSNASSTHGHERKIWLEQRRNEIGNACTPAALHVKPNATNFPDDSDTLSTPKPSK